MGEIDSFGAAKMFCRESGISAQHRKMIGTARISIVRLVELGPGIVPIVRREYSKMQMNEKTDRQQSVRSGRDIPLLPDGL